MAHSTLGQQHWNPPRYCAVGQVTDWQWIEPIEIELNTVDIKEDGTENYFGNFFTRLLQPIAQSIAFWELLICMVASSSTNFAKTH